MLTRGAWPLFRADATIMASPPLRARFFIVIFSSCDLRTALRWTRWPQDARPTPLIYFLGNHRGLRLVLPPVRMPAVMSKSRWFCAVVVGSVLSVGLSTGCSDKIGDECSLSSDCAPDGSRFCDNTQPSGYCTVVGCDFNTCPEESECVRFFTGSFANRTCDPVTEDIATDMCSPDEACAIDGRCAPAVSELRFCMLKCDNAGDCRSGYECRNLDLMRAHGGEPVVAPGETLGDNPERFCAEAPIE